MPPFGNSISNETRMSVAVLIGSHGFRPGSEAGLAQRRFEVTKVGLRTLAGLSGQDEVAPRLADQTQLWITTQHGVCGRIFPSFSGDGYSIGWRAATRIRSY